MKITETYTANKASKANRKNKTSGSNGFMGMLEVEEPESNNATQSYAPIGGLVSLGGLSLISGLDDENFKKQQNLNWGKEALKSLEELRNAIVFGSVSYNSLQKLEEQLENLPYDTIDLKLKNIIDEIKVRTSVEIEKIKRFYGSKKD